jgi:hypothetical protein
VIKAGLTAPNNLQSPIYTCATGFLANQGITPKDFRIRGRAKVIIQFTPNQGNGKGYKWVQCTKSYLILGGAKLAEPGGGWRIDNGSIGANGLDYPFQSWENGVLTLDDNPSYGASMGLQQFNTLHGRDAYGSAKTAQQALDQDPDFAMLPLGASEVHVQTFRTYLFKLGASAVPLGYYAWSFAMPVDKGKDGHVHLGTVHVICDKWKDAGNFSLPAYNDYGPTIPQK